MLRVKKPDLTLIAFTFLLCCLPLQWHQLGEIGGLAVKPFHLAVLGMVAVAVMRGQFLHAMLESGVIRLYVLSYLCYAGIIIALELSSLRILDGRQAFFKSVVYFLASLSLVYSLRRIMANQNARSITSVAVLAATAVFLLYASYIFSTHGRFFFGEVFNAAITGDVVRIQFDIFLGIFNLGGQGSTIEPGSDGFIGTSLRNTFSEVFVFFFIVHCGLHRGRREYLRLLSISANTICVIVIFISMSRSNIISLGLGVGAFLIFYVIQGKRYARIAFGRIAVVAPALVALAVLNSGLIHEPASMLGQRLAALSDDGRWVMYRRALDGIGSQPIVGNGYGETVTVESGKSVRVHNFLLASWYENGLLSFLAACLFYVSVVLLMMASYRANSREVMHGRRSVSQLWTPAVLVLPLFRSQISGDGGAFTYVEWLAVAWVIADYMNIRRRPLSLQTQDGSYEQSRCKGLQEL